MKKLMLVLLLSSMSYALNAPYLISATALSDSSAGLTWRNNDIATQGFIIERKDSTETVYHVVDSVKSSVALACTTKALRQLTLYTFCVEAYNATEVSDTSNSIQVTTLTGPPPVTPQDTFVSPFFSVDWVWDSSKSIKITIYDSSNCETGYRIYRSDGFASSFLQVAQLISTIPAQKDTIIWYDTTFSNNSWYNYKVEVFKSDSSILSSPCSTYTLSAVPPQRTVIFTKLSAFPISLWGWSAKSGDSIILKENPAPNGMFTVINVSNKSSPQFGGYIDSNLALTYPIQTQIPLYLRLHNWEGSYYNQSILFSKDKIIIGWAFDSLVRMYRVIKDSISLIDSIFFPSGEIEQVMMLNDSLMICRYYEKNSTTIFHYLSPVYLESSGFSSFQKYLVFSKDISGEYYRYVWVHGCYDNTIVTSVDDGYLFCYSGTCTFHTTSRYMTIIDLPQDRNISFSKNGSFGDGYNTGCFISDTEALSTNPPYRDGPTKLFVADVRDYNGYQRSVTNNSVFSVDTQYHHAKLMNVILDTLNRNVYLIYLNGLVILGYSFNSPSSSVESKRSQVAFQNLKIISNATSSLVTIVFPTHLTKPVDLSFYDLSGRIVDQMHNVSSNAVLWRPKAKTISCYIVMVKTGGQKYTAKFMVR